jgi:hypothetical protein
MAGDFPATMLPDATHRLLLRAALLGGEPAITAWQRWQHATHVDQLDSEAQWLLPLLYCNLHAIGVAEAHLARYASVYRHNWYKNHLLLTEWTKVLRESSAGNEPALLINAAALALLHYPRLGARPIRVLDAVVPVEQHAQIINYMAGRGWQSSDKVHHSDALGRCINVHLAWAGLSFTALAEQCTLVALHSQRFAVPKPVLLWEHLAAGQSRWDGLLLWIADAFRLSHTLGHA